VTDLAAVKNKVEQILKRSDIVVVQSRSNKISTKTGSMSIEVLSSADEALVSTMKEGKTISTVDLAKGSDATVKVLRLKNRVPMSSDNTIGFSTIIFYSEKNGVAEIIFVEDGRGYLFRETDSDIH
jgi:hypothetical protein